MEGGKGSYLKKGRGARNHTLIPGEKAQTRKKQHGIEKASRTRRPGKKPVRTGGSVERKKNGEVNLLWRHRLTLGCTGPVGARRSGSPLWARRKKGRDRYRLLPLKGGNQKKTKEERKLSKADRGKISLETAKKGEEEEC